MATNPIVLIGAYREAEVDPHHPLAAALAAIKRLPNSQRIALKGLKQGDVKALLGMVADRDAPEPLIKAIDEETEGNPFFIRELLLHLMEEGKLFRDGEGWVSRLSVEELGIPEGVRQVVGRRLSRLSDEANRLLTIGAAFKGAFSFDVAAAVAELDEQTALSASDEAIQAQLLRPGADSETFNFTHALIRHTLYSGLSPARRVRLHRKIAEAMERAWGERASEHAAEVAYQFWRGAEASGTARGVDYAIAAADHAEAAYAHDEVVAFLRIALELLPHSDSRRVRLLARLSIALVWTFDHDEAINVTREAGKLIETTEGANAAADYYESAAFAMFASGFRRGAWQLAKDGLRLAGERRDIIWASLKEIDLQREAAEDPGDPGIRTDTPGQRELRDVLKSIPLEQIKTKEFAPPFDSREEIISNPAATPQSLLFLAADSRRSLPLWQAMAVEAEREGRLVQATNAWADVAVCQIDLGDFAAAAAARDRAVALSARATSSAAEPVNMDLMGAQHDLRIALDNGWDQAIEDAATSNLAFEPTPENNWALGLIRGCAAYVFSRVNQPELAVQFLAGLPPALERGAAWEPTYGAMACDAAATLWTLNRTDLIEIIERSIREKVVAPDFRWPMRCARLSLARLCALRGDYREATEWFARARAALDERGARPLRAIADYDEAVMYLRRAQLGDTQRARPLLEAAAQQFRALGMTGWIDRAEQAAGASQQGVRS